MTNPNAQAAKPEEAKKAAKASKKDVMEAMENLEETLAAYGESHTVWAQLTKSISFGKARLNEK